MKPIRIRALQLSIGLALATLGGAAVAQDKPAVEAPNPAVTAAPSPAESKPAESKSAAATPAKADSTATPGPAASTSPAGPQAKAVAAPEGDLNPFTGQYQAAEHSKRRAEEVRAQNQLLEERIRQAALLSDLQNTPVRKQLEMRKFVDQNKPPAPPPAAVSAPAPAKDVVEASKKPASKTVLPQKPLALVKPQVVAPAIVKEPAPELVGVIRTRDGATAIVNSNGRTILARAGEQTSLGRVDEVTEDAARIGADKLVYRANRAARVTLTDPTSATAQGAGAAAVGVGAGASSGAAQAKAIALPPAPPYQAGLQLPQVPGVPSPDSAKRAVGFK